MESQLGEMTQQAKVLSPKPDYLNPIPGPHVVERELPPKSCPQTLMCRVNPTGPRIQLALRCFRLSPLFLFILVKYLN